MAWLWRACLMIGIWFHNAHGQHSFHQNVFSRRCGSSHAGFDGRPEGVPRCDFQLARGRGVCTAGPSASRSRQGRSCSMAALEKVAIRSGNDSGNQGKLSQHPCATIRRDRRYAGPLADCGSGAFRARSTPRLRCFKRSRTTCCAVLRCPPPRRAQFTCGRAQPNA